MRRARTFLTAAAISLSLLGAPSPSTAADTTLPAVPDPSFPIGSKVSRTIQKVTGINLVTEFLASKITGAVLKRKLGGKVRAKVRTYSLTDLIAGKVKSVDIRLDHSQIEGVRIGTVDLASKSPIWFKPVGFKRKGGLNTPIALAIDSEFTQTDATEALETREVISSLRGLKLDLPGLGRQQLDVVSPRVKIEDDLLKIDATLITQGASPDTGVPIKIQGRPRLVDGSKIVVEDLKLQSDCLVEPEKFASFLSDLLNPIVNFARLDTTTHAFRLSNLEVQNSLVKGRGELILVPKNYQAKVAQSP